MMLDKYCTNEGQNLVALIRNGSIKKDFRPNHGEVFHGGVEENALYDFKIYLGSLSRFLQNKRLKENHYNG